MTDTAAVLSRLSTYQIATWFMKPKHISPVECAKYGFVNTGENLIKCVECKNELRVTSDKEIRNLYPEWNELYLTHKPSCRLRNPQKIVYSEIQEFTIESFQKREEHISRTFSIYPIIDHTSFQGLSPEELKELFPLYPKFHAARVLALFGWDAESPSLLRCKICNISVSITQLEYELIQNEFQNLENIERRSLYKQSERKLRSGHVIKLAKHMHLGRAHRYYCPWINDITSNDFSYYTNKTEADHCGRRNLTSALLEQFYSVKLIINTSQATLAEHLSKVQSMKETNEFLQSLKESFASNRFPEDEGVLEEELDLPLPKSLNS
jgi:hypothetical protein